MTYDQIVVFALLPAVFALFIWGRWRHDVVAFVTLLAAVILGVVPGSEAFAGFGHPATITVAAVLVISRGLSNAGAVEHVARLVRPATGSTTMHIAALSGTAAALSGFINNVGALALFMPVAMATAAKAKRAAAVLLMPLSFGSILGGLVTLIGTPPNIIVAAYRGQALGEPFGLFDFTPVGLPLAVAGVAFVALIGWRLIPASRRAARSPAEMIDIENYVAEVRVPEDSKIVGKSVAELDDVTQDNDALIVGLIRGERRILAVRRERIRADDLLLIEASPESLHALIKALSLKLIEDTEDTAEDDGTQPRPSRVSIGSDDVSVIEAVVSTGSRLAGRAAGAVHFRRRYGVNLLAVARSDRPIRDRLASFEFQTGDVLLLQGDRDRLPEIVAQLGCLPLAERALPVGRRNATVFALSAFVGAILLAAFGLLSFPIALAGAAALMVVANIVPPRELYESIDWPVIVLLGAMIPIGGALQTSGATELLAGWITGLAAGTSVVFVLALLFVVTMTLSDVMNNAATAVIAAPLAVAIANGLGVSPDPFLMAVAVGASCAFLTPIGHQNNTLVMGPGGYRFGDYWRMGLPLEVLIVALGLPLILWAWPL
ncbi:MAG: SLC13 family permease [Rhodospirillaceae bacterium]|jgi:di/tricarboxylate transporter|nr:SLC13 family permease [Rhodospirillaceae bacterium]MBT6116442.1 SLC13 family permease [Rhodospirillaceae bacterium]